MRPYTYEDVYILSSYSIDSLTECKIRLEKWAIINGPLVIFFQKFEVTSTKKSKDILIFDPPYVILFSPSWKHLGLYPCILQFHDDNMLVILS